MSTPPLDPDDPRLTAYALGEADEDDRQAVETFLAGSAEGRAEVEQTRAIARVLAAEYAREHESYLAALPETELPSNVVAFRSRRFRSWKRASVLTLKAAAMLILAASLVYLTVRRPRRQEAVTVASAPTGEPAPAPMPNAAPRQFSRDKAVPAENPDRSDSGQKSAADHPRAETAAATLAASPGENVVDRSLAMQRQDEAAKPSDLAASGQASSRFSKALAPPRAAPARDDLESVPGAASVSAPAPRPAKPPLPEERITQSVVRIRTAAGAFFGGVFVSSDGLILAVTSLPESSFQQPCTVFLAGRRELPAFAQPAKSGLGWHWLRVEAENLPAVPLANESPANDTLLSVASVDPRTGTTTFSHVSVAEMDGVRRNARTRAAKFPLVVGSETFAFNTAGELLVIDRAVQKTDTASQAKTRSDRPESKQLIVRPFTDTERAILQQAAKRNRQE